MVPRIVLTRSGLFSLNTARPVNTVKGTRVNTARPKAVLSAVKGNKGNAIKASAYYEEIDGGFVAFGGNSKGGKITGKGKIRTSKLDFEDVYFVKELKFNLFSVSQMCDKKNSVLFTDTECVVLSPDFKLTDENHVLLKVPRKDNMYSVDLKNVVPQGGLTCLFAKATPDESNLWHRRLRHVNFKTMNKLVKGDLVRGLPSKLFEINQTCVAYQKEKQHRASSKRKNRTLIEAARTMLADLKLPTTFWAEAVNTACYVQNRVLVIKPHNKTPYELFLGRKPALSFMRPFGCPVTILNTIDHLGKFDGKADEGFFVGYSTNSKAFRVFNSRTRIVEENLHVQFSENTSNIAGSGSNWLFDIDALTKSMNYKPVVAGNQSNGSACTKACDDVGKARMETVPGKDYILLPMWPADPLFSQNSKSSPDAGFKPSREDEKKVTKEPGKEGRDSSHDQAKDDNINNTNNVNAVSSTVNAAGIEDNVVDENIVYGCADDPNIFELEDIVYSDDDEDVGVEADMNNLDAFMSVIPIPAIRIHKDHPVEQIIRDLNSAPQTRRMTKNLKEHEPKKVIQALKDPSRIEAMQDELLQFKLQKVWTLVDLPNGKKGVTHKKKDDVRVLLFMRGKIDKTLFIRRDKGDILLVQVYVDDIIFGSTKKSLCTEFEKMMHKKFQISSMSELTFLLGLQVKQKEDEIFISQDKYVNKILKKFGFSDVKTASTPMETHKPLLKDADGEDVDKHLFRSMIGSLMYLTSLRPDIVFGYPKDSPFDLVAFTNSDYAGASLDRKSITGGCQFLGCILISWQCKKQTVVANSTTEA
ncbi:putative ribonuclease H-like domain-containing protein [Tanacetum coccineum]